MDTYGKKWTWMQGELRHAFISGITEVSKQTSVAVFIDAMDEAEEDEAIQIVDDFKHLVLKSQSSDGSLHICFACRHYPNIVLDEGATICMEQHNTDDIRTFVESKVGDVPRLRAEEEKKLSDYISSRSNGIFQWAVLVLARARFLRTGGSNFDDVLERLREVPTDLHQLYKSLLSKLEDPKQTLKLFQWLLFAFRPLSTEEIQHALALSPEMPEKSISSYSRSRSFTEGSMLQARVTSLSKGLAQFSLSNYHSSINCSCDHTCDESSKPRVSFIHQSVADYLLDGGLQALEVTKGDSIRESAHFTISRCCLRYLFMKEVRDQVFQLHNVAQEKGKRKTHPLKRPRHGSLSKAHHASSSSSEGLQSERDVSWRPDWVDTFEMLDTSLFPLSEYAWAFWIQHAQEANSSMPTKNLDLLDFFYRPTKTEFWVGLSQVLRQLRGPISSWPTPKSTLTHLLAIANIRGPLSQIQQYDEKALDAKDSRGRTPLSYAVELQSRSVVDDLLQFPVEVNFNDENGKSLLQLAAIRGDERIIHALLKAGADPNLTDRLGATPLHAACQHSSTKMVRKTSFVTQQASRSALFEMSKDFVGVAMRLIQYGANVNATNSIHETPLHLATSSPPEIIELLINAQADPNSKDYIGQTPLCYAVREGQPSIVSLLAHLGADVNSPDILGEAPLSDAAGRGRVSIVKILLRMGARLNARDKHGRSALYYAAKYCQPFAAHVLLDAGCDVNPPFSGAFSALRYSWRNEKSPKQVLAWLKDARAGAERSEGHSWNVSRDSLISEGIRYINRRAEIEGVMRRIEACSQWILQNSQNMQSNL